MTSHVIIHDLYREQTKDTAKSPEMLEKIIAGNIYVVTIDMTNFYLTVLYIFIIIYIIGKVNKRLSEICLLSQSHMAVEGSPVIQKYLQTLPFKIDITSFYRWSLGQK